ncbi:unnamed protein product [Ectocarpus sp. 4 AP-2014]
MATTISKSKTKKKKKRKKKADITTLLHEVFKVNTLRRNDDKLSQLKFQRTTCLETVGYSEV